MKPFITIDCETDPFQHGRVPQPFLWCAYDGRCHSLFTETSAFVSWLKKRDCIAYAHNGGKFDFHYLLPYIDKEHKPLIINGRLATFRLGACELRDSYLLIPQALKNYKKTDIDYDKMEAKARDAHMDEITAYIKDDCTHLFDILKTFMTNYGQHLTLPTAALKTYKARFKTCDNKITSNQDYFTTFQPFYMGGRVECFSKGIITQAGSVVDINSAYPYAMTHPHPIGVLYDTGNHAPDAIHPHGFYAASCMSKGALPYRTPKGLTFPHGQITGFFTGHELLAGLETNTIHNLNIQTYYHHHHTTTFTAYVDHFFALKAANKNNPAHYLIAKLFLNSLYGKFGQNSGDYREYEVKTLENMTVFDELHCQVNDKYVITTQPITKPKYYNVATAASITGFVRAHLWRAIQASSGVHYCDTDCLIATAPNVSRGTLLGEWSLETDYSQAAIAGKKLYALQTPKGYKVRSKGAVLTANDIFNICQGHTVTYKKPAPTFSLKHGARFIVRELAMTA